MKRKKEVFLQILFQTLISILKAFQVGKMVEHLLTNKLVTKIHAGIALKYLQGQTNSNLIKK
jgi:hypothetical protein